MKITLSSRDAQELDHLEGVITGGITTFSEVGAALMQIKSRKLYRTNYATFEIYCQQRWGISRWKAYRMIETDVVNKEVDKMLRARNKNTPSSQLEPAMSQRLARNVNAESRRATGPRADPQKIKAEILKRIDAHEQQARHDREKALARPKRNRLEAIEKHHRAILREIEADQNADASDVQIDTEMADYLRRASMEALATIAG